LGEVDVNTPVAYTVGIGPRYSYVVEFGVLRAKENLNIPQTFTKKSANQIWENPPQLVARFLRRCFLWCLF